MTSVAIEFEDSGCEPTPNKPAVVKSSIQQQSATLSDKMSAASLSPVSLLHHPNMQQKKQVGKLHPQSMPSLLKSPIPPLVVQQHSKAPPPNLSPSPLFSESSAKTLTNTNPAQVLFSENSMKAPIGPIGDNSIHLATAPGAIGRPPSHHHHHHHHGNSNGISPHQNAMHMIFGRGLNEEDGSDFYEDEKKAFFLGGLHRDMQREDIYNELQKYGLYIRKLDCPYNDKSTKSGNKGYAFVHVKDEGMALKILSLEKLKILNETCSVKPYKRDPSNRKKSGGPGNGNGHDARGMNGYAHQGGLFPNKSKSFDPTRMDFTHIANQQNMQNSPHLLAMFWQARFEELYKAHVMLLQGHFMGNNNGNNITHNMPPFPSPWAPASLMQDYHENLMNGGHMNGPGGMHPGGPHGPGQGPPYGPFGKHAFNAHATSFFPTGMPAEYHAHGVPPHGGGPPQRYGANKNKQDDRLSSILGGVDLGGSDNNKFGVGYSPIGKPKTTMSKPSVKGHGPKGPTFLEDDEEVGIHVFKNDMARLESNSSEKIMVSKSAGGLRIEAPRDASSPMKMGGPPKNMTLSKSLGSPQPAGGNNNTLTRSASTHGSSLGHSPLAGGRGKRESQSLSISESLGKQAAMASSPGSRITEKGDELAMLANPVEVKAMTPAAAFKKQSSIFDDKQLTLPSDESQRFFSTSRTTSSSSDKN